MGASTAGRRFSAGNTRGLIEALLGGYEARRGCGLFSAGNTRGLIEASLGLLDSVSELPHGFSAGNTRGLIEASLNRCRATKHAITASFPRGIPAASLKQQVDHALPRDNVSWLFSAGNTRGLIEAYP